MSEAYIAAVCEKHSIPTTSRDKIFDILSRVGHLPQAEQVEAYREIFFETRFSEEVTEALSQALVYKMKWTAPRILLILKKKSARQMFVLMLAAHQPQYEPHRSTKWVEHCVKEGASRRAFSSIGSRARQDNALEELREMGFKV
jgi:hypothetical protein